MRYLFSFDWSSILTIVGFIVSVISVAVSAFTLLFLRRQLNIIVEHNRQLHEMERRENACNIVAQWSHNLKKEESIAKRIVEKFDEKQSRALFDEQEFLVTRDHYDKLMVVLGTTNCNNGESCDVGKEEDTQRHFCDDCYQKNMVKLEKRQVILLRWYIMHYLNDLECVLLQCKQGIADEDVFFEQFQYQYNTQNGVMALKTFRTIAGGSSCYPATEWFCANMEEKLKNDIIKKKHVDTLD